MYTRKNGHGERERERKREKHASAQYLLAPSLLKAVSKSSILFGIIAVRRILLIRLLSFGEDGFSQAKPSSPVNVHTDYFFNIIINAKKAAAGWGRTSSPPIYFPVFR
jgi:hypothetical protein